MGMERLFSRIAGTIRDSKKRTNILIVLAAVAALLVVLSDMSCAPEENETHASEFSLDAYAAELEDKLERIISAVEGAGETKVMVTLQNGMEYIYASEDSTSTDLSKSVDSSGRESNDERSDHQSNYIIIDTDQGEKALVCTELMPTVSGVVVVCSGAADPQVAERIMAVVTTALNISSKRVCITQLSQ